MLQCRCGGTFHPLDVEEESAVSCLARLRCEGCRWDLGIEGDPQALTAILKEVVWTWDALDELSRLPPYLSPMVREHVEQSVRSRGGRVVTFDLYHLTRGGEAVYWDPEAERRLERIPAAVRSMARIELERTASERGDTAVTVGLMEEVKARYFGMGTTGKP